MGLVDAMNDPVRKKIAIADCSNLIDEEVDSRSGLSGFALKAGYSIVKKIKNGFIESVLDALLPEFAAELDPLWEKGKEQGSPEKFFQDHKSEVAEALLKVTDGKAKNSTSDLIRKTYSKLRGSAHSNVEMAVPRLAGLLAKHS